MPPTLSVSAAAESGATAKPSSSAIPIVLAKILLQMIIYSFEEGACGSPESCQPITVMDQYSGWKRRSFKPRKGMEFLVAEPYRLPQMNTI